MGRISNESDMRILPFCGRYFLHYTGFSRENQEERVRPRCNAPGPSQTRISSG
ncbi:hypothetical protein HMPREF1546_03105 [Oscillibacter sp. KLE 1745]|nr:hypothetical protein HMPREF1546_03105 [Oscillibacter sp. KLE 1745]